MRIECNCPTDPEVELLPRIINTPSRLNCRFGWNEMTTREFSCRDFENLVLMGGSEQKFQVPNLGAKALEIETLSLQSSATVEGLEQFENLKSIEIHFMPKNGIELFRFRHLNSVFSDRNKQIEKQILQLSGLEYLGLVGYSGIDCSAFSSLTQLKAISLTQGRLQYLEGLEKCHELEDVSLAYLRNLSDLTALEKHTGLTDISLTNLPKAAGSIIISNYPALQSLYVMGCNTLVDLSDLSTCKRLKKLALNAPHTGLIWSDLFLLNELKVVALMADETVPSDRELTDLSIRNGRTSNKIERAGTRKKSHLRMYFS